MRASNNTSSLLSLRSLPSRARIMSAVGAPLEDIFLIYDQKLEKAVPGFAKWARLFPIRAGLKSGESLKDLSAFPKNFAKLNAIAASIPPRRMTVLAVGGGTIGDFSGFFASVYKRGVRLVHMPSTWLAAIDSSHGGKTALNAQGAKNQVGTFYPAERVIMVRDLLFAQGEERARDALGELAKIALIDGGTWVRKLRAEKSPTELVWKNLPHATAAKLNIVAKDPFERLGYRQILNLGHTVGHVFESAHGLSHGRAIAAGLFFALEFSLNERIINKAEFARATDLLVGIMKLEAERLRPISYSRFLRLIGQDKKREQTGQVTYIFLRAIGRVERRSIAIDDLLKEARRQGIVK